MLDAVVEKVLEYLVPICELMGILIVAISVIKSFITYFKGLLDGKETNVKYDLASGLALSLEFKMAAEILKTVIVKELSELIVLGAVIALRALLSILIHFELKGQEEKQKALQEQEAFKEQQAQKTGSGAYPEERA